MNKIIKEILIVLSLHIIIAPTAFMLSLMLLSVNIYLLFIIYPLIYILVIRKNKIIYTTSLSFFLFSITLLIFANDQDFISLYSLIGLMFVNAVASLFSSLYLRSGNEDDSRSSFEIRTFSNGLLFLITLSSSFIYYTLVSISLHFQSSIDTSLFLIFISPVTFYIIFNSLILKGFASYIFKCLLLIILLLIVLQYFGFIL